MNKLKNNNAARILFSAGIVAILVFATWELFGPQLPELIRMLRDDQEEEIVDYLSSQGQWRGLLSMFFLSIIQVISVVIPGIIIHITNNTLCLIPEECYDTYIASTPMMEASLSLVSIAIIILSICLFNKKTAAAS